MIVRINTNKEINLRSLRYFFMQKKEIELDTFSCKKCGACAEVAPEHFEMDEDTETPRVLDPIIEGEHQDLEQAKAFCPSESIEIKVIEE